MNEQETVNKAIAPKMVKVQIELYEPFYNFIKEYLAYFGSDKTIEVFSMQAVYDKIKMIYTNLEEFACEEHRQIEPKEWFNKWPAIGCAAFEEPDEK